MSTKCLNDFRLRFGKQELVPIMVGGMGVDISTVDLALEAARLGGIGHISDAMVQTVSDRRDSTHFTKEKLKRYKYNVANSDKAAVLFDLGRLAEATHNHVGRAMQAKRGEGMIFVNCMEKLTMNAPKDTLRVRLATALDAGIDPNTIPKSEKDRLGTMIFLKMEGAFAGNDRFYGGLLTSGSPLVGWEAGKQ